MKSLFHHRLGTFLIGVVIGALCIWVLGLLVHIPGENTSYTSVTTYSSKSPNQGTVHVRNAPSGTSTNDNIQTSSSLPSSIPVYTPSSFESSNDNKYFYASQSPDYTVINYYGEELSTNGWKITTESTENGSTTINASGNGYTMSVTITGASNNGSQFIIQQS